jgi:divalent metal cation (Fe/Co/Zn/Cd) transporter
VTDIKWLDPVVAMLVALFIIRESYSLLKRAFTPLLDTAWNEDEIDELERKLNEMEVNYHSLRTRIAGNYRFIDIHVEIPEAETVGSAHEYCDMIENKLTSSYENLSVTIHVEPRQATT